MRKSVLILVVALCAAGAAAWLFRGHLHMLLNQGILAIKGKRSVADVLAEYGARADEKWKSEFAAADASYPPESLVLIAFKDERLIEVWSQRADGAKKIAAYPILAASGGAGPKLVRGDKQVPEGFYGIDTLNPNSRFHLSMRVNYPNTDDLAHAQSEGRHDPGDDIFIHGGSASVGCLAIGDPAIEELFVLVARAGQQNTRLLICPADFRQRAIAPQPSAPPWVGPLYEALATELRTRFSAS